MMLSTISILLFILISVTYCRQICYTGYGCFQDTYPFGGSLQRPISALPESPEKISTKFTLYKRDMFVGEEISASAIGSNYDPLLPTKLITHGFLHNAQKKWVIDMKNAILNVENVNVITIDWSKGNGLPYTQATANTQIVGAEIAILVNALIANRGAKAKDFHGIGHSLGAHIFGYAGSRVTGFGRITGLDPAGPYFENTDPIVRLDPTDANFVESIHTDGTANLQLGLGLIQPISHVDYYPNGGKDQPSCPGTSLKLLGAIFNIALLSIEGVEETISCSHQSSVTFFTDSIENKCKYTAYPCNSKDEFDKGNCIKCSSSKGCNRMGYWSSPSKELGTLYLDTQTPTKTPLCKQDYQVVLVSNRLSNQVQARGKFTVYFKTTNQKVSSIETLDDSITTFKADSVEVRLVSLNTPLYDADLTSIFVSYSKTGNLLTTWLYDSQWSFRYVDVFSGDDQKPYRFCPTTQLIQSGSTIEFQKC